MNGAQGVAVAIDAFLIANVQAEMDRLAVELGPPVPDADPSVPQLDAVPRLFAPHQLAVDDVGIDDWPFVVTVVTRMQRQRRIDVFDDGSIAYERDYPCRVFGWARGDGFGFTAAVRDRLTLGIVTTLLRDQRFGVDWLRLEEASLQEFYSDVGDDTTLAATIAASRIEFTVCAAELLTPTRPPLGVVDETVLTTRPLANHPAL